MADRFNIANTICTSDAVEVDNFAFVRYFNHDSEWNDVSGNYRVFILEVEYEHDYQKFEYLFTEEDLSKAEWDEDKGKWLVPHKGTVVSLEFFTVLPNTPYQIPED